MRLSETSSCFFLQDFENWDDVGLNVERPPDLVTLFRHRSRPLVQSHNTQTEETGTQTWKTSPNIAADAPSIPPTEYPSHDENIIPTSVEKPTQEPKLKNHKLPESSSASDCSLIHNHQEAGEAEPQASQSVVHSDLPNSSTHLQHSARVFKEELQHGVEDVRQKLHSFFSRSHPVSGDSKTVPSTVSQNTKKPDPPHLSF